MSVTIILIIITILLSIQGFNNQSFLLSWSYSPYLVKVHQEYPRIFQHMFVHVDWGHLFFNMYTLYMFGEIIEKILQMQYGFWPGTIYYLVLYFAGGVAATVWPYIRNHNNDLYYSVGASGAVSAVLFATVVWLPTMKLSLIFIPFEFPAYIFAGLYLLFEYIMMQTKKSKIAHDAHIGGAVFGILFIFLINIEKAKELFSLITN